MSLTRVGLLFEPEESTVKVQKLLGHYSALNVEAGKSAVQTTVIQN